MNIEDFQPLIDRFQEIDRKVSSGELPPSHPDFGKLLRERTRLEATVAKVREYRDLDRQIADAQALAADPDMAAMAKEEVGALNDRRNHLTEQLEDYLLSDKGPVATAMLMEIRPGTGGDEAALFAGELFRMYLAYARRRGWKAEIVEHQDSALGGTKSATVSIEGEEAYRRLWLESGTHRVQRVPATEASGRIHTSTATVAVLPEYEDVEVDIRREDLRIDTYSAGGPGGQHVNKTASAVRLTHLPTGIVVACQSERSQHRNRDLAMRWLKARLLEHLQAEQKKEIDDLRRSQIGTGDRSEKIRTYNFPQSRITDHRVGFSVHSLIEFMNGDLDDLVDALLKADRAERLKARSKK